MKATLVTALFAALLASFSVFAATPTDAPAAKGDVPADKKPAMDKKAAPAKTNTAPAAATGTAPATAATPAAAPATPPATTTATPPVKGTGATTTAKTKGSAMPTEAAPGGGTGKVWVNASSKVYHCSGSKWYGKTKKGEYMVEADAKAKGFHGDHGATCKI